MTDRRENNSQWKEKDFRRRRGVNGTQTVPNVSRIDSGEPFKTDIQTTFFRRIIFEFKVHWHINQLHGSFTSPLPPPKKRKLPFFIKSAGVITPERFLTNLNLADLVLSSLNLRSLSVNNKLDSSFHYPETEILIQDFKDGKTF